MLRESKRDRHQIAGRAFGAQVGPRRFLPGKTIQVGLGIKKIALKRTTIHEQMNDPLGAWRKMRSSRSVQIESLRDGKSPQCASRMLKPVAPMECCHADGPCYSR